MKTDSDSGNMSARAGKIFQLKLESYKQKSDWFGLIKMLKRYAKRYPNAYFVHQQLAATLYVDGIAQFHLAFQHAERAKNIEPDDDLNIYTYACALYYVGKLEKSFEYLTKIINKDIHEIAYGEHGEGLRYAKQLINDSVYMAGVVCQGMHRYNEAKDYFMRYLENKKPFQYSNFTKKQAMSHLSELVAKRQSMGMSI